MYVLITGAAGGLGRAFAMECAKRGYDLFLTDINSAGLKLIESGVKSCYSVRVLTKACDLTDGGDVEALFACVRENNVRFEMLLNVAGVDYEGGFIERSADAIIKIVQLNVEATLRITHKVLEYRAAEQPFYMVFVSSLASFYPMPLKATYAASKSFLLDFSYALGQELRHLGVKVLSLCPGGLPTTSEALRGIAAQGFWGNVTTNRLERVTQKTIARVLRGKAIYIPGLLNRTFTLLGSLVPRRTIAKLLYSRWSNAQKQWLNIGKVS
jgi:short-subunit dehydrogenase